MFVARGDIFTAPIEKGATRNLTNSSNAHDKHASWSPDGRKIVFISDRSGEEQLYLIDQDGHAEPDALTTNHQVMLMRPEWSPDGKRLAYADKDGKLFVLTLETKAVVEIVDNPRGGISDYTWSPHGGHLTFTMGEPNGFSRLYTWTVADGQVRAITESLFDVGSPAWGAEGNYLYYVSRREFAPQVSNIEWNYAGNRNLQVYALALRKDVKNPFGPESDEVTLEDKEKPKDEEKKEDSENEKDAKKEAPEPIVIDFDGLASCGSPSMLEISTVFQPSRGIFFTGRLAPSTMDATVA